MKAAKDHQVEKRGTTFRTGHPQGYLMIKLGIPEAEKKYLAGCESSV